MLLLVGLPLFYNIGSNNIYLQITINYIIRIKELAYLTFTAFHFILTVKTGTILTVNRTFFSLMLTGHTATTERLQTIMVIRLN